VDREAAETVAAQALAFLAEAPARLHRFLLASGLEPGDLRARAGTPEVLLAVLEHLAGDESLLLVFAASRQVAPERVGQAIARLQAPAS
jgi:uncharacterized protein DUF3572